MLSEDLRLYQESVLRFKSSVIYAGASAVKAFKVNFVYLLVASGG